MIFNQYCENFVSANRLAKNVAEINGTARGKEIVSGKMLPRIVKPKVNEQHESQPGSFMGPILVPKLCRFYRTKSLDYLTWIISYQSKVYHICECCGESPFHFAVRLNSPELLNVLAGKLMIDLTNHLGETALHLACEYGKDDMAARLLDLGANPLWTNFCKETCMFICMKKDYTKVAEVILRKTYSTHQLGYYLMMATRFGSKDFAQLFLKHKATNIDYTDSEGKSAVSLAIECGDVEVLDCLLEHGANIKTERLGLLHLACKLNREACVEKLLHAGAPVHRVNQKRETPLHVAAQYSSLKIVKMLTSLNSNIEAKDLDNRTPLFIAILHNKPQTVEHLLSLGASTKSVVAPLIWRLKNNDLLMIKLLVNHGLSIHQTDRLGHNLLNASMMFKCSINIKNFLREVNTSREL